MTLGRAEPGEAPSAPSSGHGIIHGQVMFSPPRYSYEEVLAQYERRGVGVLVVSPRADWFPRVEVPPEGREEFVALLLLAAEDGEGAAAAQPASTSRRGRRYGRVSVFEANRVAGVYVSDPAEYDARDDGGAYAVHKLYVEGREPGTALLSRSMVGHLLSAIR